MKKIASLTFIITFSIILCFAHTAAYAESSEVNSKKAQIEEYRSEINSLNKEITSLEEEIFSLNQRIEALSEEIGMEEAKLKRIREQIKERRNILSKRARHLYVEGETYNLSLILEADSFKEFIERTTLLYYLVKGDSKNIEQLESHENEAIELVEKLNRDKSTYKAYLEGYKERTKKLSELKETKTALLSEAKYELSIILEREESVSSRGNFRKTNSYYSLNGVVPRKFVEVSPYGNDWLTTGRMPDKYISTGKKWNTVASWYGNQFHGRRTASGEIFNQWDFTVAHRNLSFGTFVAIERNGRKIVAKVTDRGPFISGREFDLSRACAEALGFSGVANVQVEIIKPAN